MTRLVPILAAVGAACGHSPTTAIAPIIPSEGPFAPADDIRLTYNPLEDYWPAWTQDGAAILYVYNRGRADGDRCIGLLPPEGGTLLFNLCDDRAIHTDSTDGFSAPALSTDGRLIALQTVTALGKEVPDATELWVADTSHPTVRQTLLHFPMMVADTPINWLSDIQWSGPDQFVALAQRAETFPHCPYCFAADTLYLGLFIVRGTISSAGASLEAVDGTLRAQTYSLAENGSTLVFVRRGSLLIERIPLAGGASSIVTALPNPEDRQILGISCRATLCLLATDRLLLTRPPPPVQPPPAGDLRSLSLLSGTVTTLRRAQPGTTLWATPQLAPDGSGDVVLHVIGPTGADLYLFKGLLP